MCLVPRLLATTTNNASHNNARAWRTKQMFLVKGEKSVRSTDLHYRIELLYHHSIDFHLI
jgi:hypothetical protein